MVIGVPKEIKDHEYRVSVTPDGVRTLRQAGHDVWIEPSAGVGSGYSDEDYRNAGATMAESKEQLFQQAAIIVKVKEPLLSECRFFRPGQTLFTYLHLASLSDLTKALLDTRITAIAYETIEAKDGTLPMLKPMSEIAGRMSVQIGAHYLEKTQGGCGILLAGVPGVEPGKVVVLGAGVVGQSATRIAVGMGAQVTYEEQSPAYWTHNNGAPRPPHRPGPNGLWVSWSRNSRLDRPRHPPPRPLASCAPPIHVRRVWELEHQERGPLRSQDLRPSRSRQSPLGWRHASQFDHDTIRRAPGAVQDRD